MPAATAEPRHRSGFAIGLAVLWVTVFSGFAVLVEPAPYDLLMMAMLAVFAVTGLVRLPPGSGAFLYPLAVFAIGNLIACFFSFDIGRSLFFMGVTFYLVLAFIFVTCLIYEDYERVTSVIWSAYIVAAIFASVLAVLGYFHLLPDADIFTRGGRGRGLFKDPNVLGPFLVPAAIYLFSKFETRTSLRPAWALVFVTVTVVGILMSFSRGAAGNLAVGLLAYVFFRLTTNKSGQGLTRLVWSAVLIVLVGGAVVAWVVLNTQAGETFAFKAHLLRHYDAGRFAAQEEGLETILSWPFGIGPGLANRVLDTELATHNLFIQLFLEDGWLAGIAFVVFLGLTLVRALRLLYGGFDDPRYMVALASFLGLLGISFVIDSIHWRHFFLILSLLWGPILLFGGLRQRSIAEGLQRDSPAASGRASI